MLTYVAIILCIVYCLIIIFYAVGWYKTEMYTNKSNNYYHQYNYSIIIPARNESDNIIRCLQSIIKNDFPKNSYEIIVIDDYSEDDTAELVTQFFDLNHQGKLIKIADLVNEESRITAFKKFSIDKAISISNGDYIIQTDADCVVDKYWLSTIDNFVKDNNPLLIAGPVSFLKVKNKLLYLLQSIDFFTMQGITAASHYWQVGLMSNGANFIYSKQAYNDVNGFKDINHIPSGDDMMLMQKIAHAYPKRSYYLKNKHAIVLTNAQPTWTDFINQRIRWSSKNNQYQDKRLTMILAIVYFFNVVLLLIFILGIFKSNFIILGTVLLILKIIVELLLVVQTAGFFNKSIELVAFPLLQPLHIVYVTLVGFLGKFGSYKWKSRIIKI